MGKSWQQEIDGVSDHTAFAYVIDSSFLCNWGPKPKKCAVSFWTLVNLINSVKIILRSIIPRG